MIFNERVISSNSRLPKLVDEALASIPESARLLDIGSGCGRLTRTLCETRDDISVVGIEYDSELARLPASREHQQSVISSADTLPFESEAFDAVVAINALHEVVSASSENKRLERLDTVIKGISRTLKPGGLLLIYDGIMPPNEYGEVSIEPRSPASRGVLQQFATEYLARPTRLEEVEDGRFISDIGTVTTFLTKYSYLSSQKAWDGEQRQLYPFATKDQLSDSLTDSGMFMVETNSPNPSDRKGLKKLLANFTVQPLSGEPYDATGFPDCQALTRAYKR